MAKKLLYVGLRSKALGQMKGYGQAKGPVGVPIGAKGKGWHQQTMRHSNAKKFGKAGGPYKSKTYVVGKEHHLVVPRSQKGSPKKHYQLTLSYARSLGLIDNDNNLTKKGNKLIDNIRTYDTDGDGVPDVVDCEPLNPSKHGRRAKLETLIGKELSPKPTKTKTPKKKEFSHRERELMLREERLRFRKELAEEEREAKVKTAKAKKLKEEARHEQIRLKGEAVREQILLPKKHMGEKRILSERLVEARKRGDIGDIEDIQEGLVKLEKKEPKMFIKGSKRLAKLQEEQAETAEARRKISQRKLKAMKKLPRKIRIAKIKRFIRIPQAVARAEVIAAKTLPMAGESKSKVEPKFQPIF